MQKFGNVSVSRPKKKQKSIENSRCIYGDYEDLNMISGSSLCIEDDYEGLEKEYELYLNHKVSYHDVGLETDELLNWWRDNENRYPILSKVAK